jgi:hypothetical protein
VVLLTDVAGSTWEELTRNPDTENRTFYVGITRTRQNLNVIQSFNEQVFYNCLLMSIHSKVVIVKWYI